MKLPKKMTVRAGIIITCVITIPMFLFSYIFALETKDNLYNETELDMLELAIGLEKRLPDYSWYFENIESRDEFSNDQKTQILNRHLQPYAEEIKEKYPNYVLGYYCEDINRMIVIGSEIYPEFTEYYNDLSVDFFNSNQKGEYLFIQHDESIGWDGDPILNLSYPVNRGSYLAGHTWAYTKTEDINREFYHRLLKNIVFTIGIWLSVILIITWLFHKYSAALTRLAEQIKNKNDDTKGYESFPELLPVLDTVIDFRERVTHQNNLLKLMIEEIPGAFIAIDKNLIITIANKEAGKLLDKQCIIGCSVKEFLIKYNIEENVPHVLKTLNYGKIYIKEKFAVGEMIFRVNSSPIIDPITDEIIGAVCYFIDVTEEEQENIKTHKLLEEYFNKTKNLQRLIDAIPIAFLAVDKTMRIISINERLINLFDLFEMSELIGEDLFLISQRLNTPLEKLVIYRALQGEELKNEPCHVMGRELLVNGYPIRREDEKIIGAITIFQDITELEILRNEITNMERLNLVGQMAASITHEIRNPMATIRGFIQLLKERSITENQHYYQIIINELDRANNIISDFLSLSQNRVIEMNQYNLNNIINELYPILSADANIKGHFIDLELDNTVPDLLLNKKEIKQLILNLARNSTESMINSGRLLISTKNIDGNEAELQISDTGCGIPNSILKKIFDPFYTTKEGGTGLGLPVSKSIVEKHNGKIIINSIENVGTTFIIRFKI